MINDDDYRTCPYNTSHRILVTRFPHHLIKCQKNNPPLIICPFNATHRYNQKEIKEHCLQCPDRKPFEYDYKAAKKITIGAMTAPKPILQKEYLPEQDRDYWDD
ncbi:gametocyte-specific factor 1-like [Trichoplusia ni]|uniref:Gametocyte-specific factor 1-like n=1 Tax=Trichoplusia ni TaxID=7111 RepID=A0A7E5VBB1_TRINI|nr:gametocyte-specific factor 1-like [Trichoplusia ni]XP_026725569.1 gametocyte-specific factor 1-like [Trichoplusia ni]